MSGTITLPADPDEERALARDPNTPPSVLDAIARRPLRDDYDGYAREDVAANPSTPVPTLRWLSTVENDSQVINGLLGNPSTPEDIIRAHMHRDEYARRIVAGRARISDGLMFDVVQKPRFDRTVYMTALNNKAIPVWTFNRLIGLQSGNRQYGLMIAAARSTRSAEVND